jgi:CheY-like chemotaxis protein
VTCIARPCGRGGLHPVAAADGWEALVCARTLIPALVITDLRMPGLGGRELLARLRAAPATAHIPAIIVSAGDDARAIAHGLGADLVAKPVALPALRTAVDALLGRGGAR